MTWRPDELERRARVEAGEAVLAHLTHDLSLVAWAKATGVLVRIDRRGPWGNPFRIGPDGDRDEVCRRFATYFETAEELRARLPELRGRLLVCWCTPKRCHGETLLEALSRINPSPLVDGNAPGVPAVREPVASSTRGTFTARTAGTKRSHP